MERVHHAADGDADPVDLIDCPHSRRDYDGVVSPIIGGRQIRNTSTLAPSLDQFPGHVAGDVQRLGNGSALRDEAGKFVRDRKKHPFGQFFDLYPNRQLHTSRS